MSQNVNVTRPRYHRTHSLDSADSLERLEAHQYYRQQFLATRAKFNHDEALPSTLKPRAVRIWPSASQNHRDNAQLLLVPPTNQIDGCSTLSYTSKISMFVSSGDEFDAKTAPLQHEQSCSTSPLGEIIEKFTSEITNSEIPSMELQSRSSVKESLDSESSDGTHSFWESTAGSFAQTPMFSRTLRGNAAHHDTLQPVLLAAPLQTPNLLKQTEALDQHSDIESDVILHHLSDSWLHPNSAEPLVQESVTNTDTIVFQRAISLQMPPTYVTDSEALETDINTPVRKEVKTSLTAVPFRPCEWAKLPVTNGDKTDEAQSQISLLPSSTFEMEGSSTQPTSAAEPLLMKSPFFHSYPVREGSSSHVASISSLPHLRHQEQRLSDVSTDQNLSSERSARQAIQPKNAPNEIAMKGYSTQPSVVQPCMTRAPPFHSYHVTEESTSNGVSVSSLPYLKSQEQRINDPSRVQNLPSERFAREVIQPQTTPNIPLSPQKQTDSVDFVSNDESENKHKHSNSRFNSNGQFVRRPGTSSFRSSFQRRSQTPSVPVKLLIKKFSENN